MKTKTKTATHPVDRMFRAMSDRTRLRILALLQDGELCVCDLVTVLDIPQPTASRHLAYLRRAGLALARKEGQWHFYRLASPQVAFHEKLLECLRCCLSDVPEITRDLKRLESARRSRPCCE